jgi:glycosyltransferase involved in cell wall biosynthesis
MKRVLFIDQDSGFTGSTISLKYIVEKFTTNNVEVYIATEKDRNDYSFYEKIGARVIPIPKGKLTTMSMYLCFTNTLTVFSLQGIKVFLYDAIKFFYGIFIFYFLIRKIKPDLLYVNEYVILQASIAAKMLGIPTVMHIRSRIINGTFGFRRYLLTRLSLFTSNTLIAITEIEAKPFLISSLSQNKVKVVGEFLDKENFRSYPDLSSLKISYGLPTDKILVLMLGGIFPIKGTYNFLLAAQLACSKNKKIFFVLAGKEDNLDRIYYGKCKDLLNDKNLSYYIKSVGIIKNVKDLIACSDIIISSNSETHFSRPVIEAWAAQKPVIATDTLHSAKLIDHMRNGILVPVENSERLSEAILDLAKNETLRKTLGLAGFRKAKAHFDSAENLEKIFLYCSSACNCTKK